MAEDKERTARRPHTLSARQMMSIRFDTVLLGGGWDECLGPVQTTGVWFIWGNSGNGKTSAVVSLCRELAAFGRVLLDSREEGVSLTLQNTLRRFGMQELGARFQVTDAPLDELESMIERRKGPRFVVIDSFQYMGLSYRQFRAFCDRHRGRLLIFVSRADGRRPEGRAATSAMYDAALKIWVEGYKAFSKGRFIGSTAECTIWEDGARRYWGTPADEENENTDTEDGK